MIGEVFTGIYAVTVLIAFFFMSWNERQNTSLSSKPRIDDADFYIALLFALGWPLVVLMRLFFVAIDKWKLWVSNGR